MTTAVKKQRARPSSPKPEKKAKAKSPLRIRPELLPESAMYITIFDVDHIAIPMTDFRDWYEGIESEAVREYAENDAATIRAAKKRTPDTARRIAVDKIKYIAVPVVDFAEWYEDIWDIAVCRYADENPEPAIPIEEVFCGSIGKANGKA